MSRKRSLAVLHRQHETTIRADSPVHPNQGKAG